MSDTRAMSDCRVPAGAMRPVIDRNRCEGKGDCTNVCPYHVFEIRKIDRADRAQLSLAGRLKSFAHRGKTSYTPHEDACMACGKCVKACPEKAITLVRAGAAR